MQDCFYTHYTQCEQAVSFMKEHPVKAFFSLYFTALKGSCKLTTHMCTYYIMVLDCRSDKSLVHQVLKMLMNLIAGDIVPLVSVHLSFSLIIF